LNRIVNRHDADSFKSPRILKGVLEKPIPVEQRRHRAPATRQAMRPGGVTVLRRVCLVALLVTANGLQSADRAALKTAVKAWCTDIASATTTYSDINTCDVRTCIFTHYL